MRRRKLNNQLCALSIPTTRRRGLFQSSLINAVT